MATQLVKIALCESYGAAACFDYHSSTCGADICVHTDNIQSYIPGCVTNATTMKMCYEAIGAFGGRYIALETIATTVKHTRRDVRANWFLANTIMEDALPHLSTGSSARLEAILGGLVAAKPPARPLTLMNPVDSSMAYKSSLITSYAVTRS
ncbi:hypothetical protein F4678DRAFT_456824 [Xylaria arbuscula]|nr:hypothetical protein F4678DRAFT_456824 [Xylaria arbuscula]